MQNMNLSQEKMDALLRMAGQKLGKSPEQLRASLENGDISKAVAGLDPKIQAQIGSLLQNPKALEALLGNDKIRSMLGNLGGK